MQAGDSHNATGSQCNLMAKTRISSGATTKPGTQTASIARKLPA